jgi:F0F1-type ATP synthase assembly protein I
MKDKRDDAYVMLGRYLGLATLLPATTVIGYAIGYLLDKAFGTTYLKIVFLLLGIAAGLIELIRELTKDAASND